MIAFRKTLIPFAKRRIKNVCRPLKNPWVTRGILLKRLGELEVQKGGTLLVHGSMSRLGFVLGGPQTVINALLEFLGPSGTLVFPTHTWEQVNAGLRRFDVMESPGCIGALSEEFRRMDKAIRSIHPTHSIAAIGPRATEIVDGHELASTPCGPGTPYDKIMRSGGQILFLGVGLESNTCYHCIEATVELPWLHRTEHIEFELVDRNRTITQGYFKLHQEGIERRYPETEEWLEKCGAAKRHPIGASECLLLDGERFYNLATEKLAQCPDWLRAD